MCGNLIKRILPEAYDAKTDDGAGYTYAYDKMNRLIRITDSTGAHLSYAYNERNQRTMEKQAIAKGVYFERHYEYSPAGRIVRVAERADESSCNKSYVSTSYAYDKNGNITRIQTPTGHEILREYDVCDRLIAETHKEKGGSIYNRTTYTYDEMGNRTQVCFQNGYQTTYVYDHMNRLCQETDSDGAM